jgi:hypothetical protein
MSGQLLTGTLLCQAGSYRIAFPAQDVAVIDVPTLHVGRWRSASQAFGEPTAAFRVLLAPSGETVGVDSLEIDSEEHGLMAPPPVLARCVGGSLMGFIYTRGALWPVVRLVEFEHFLAGASREAA